MRGKRAKQYRKVMQQFSQTFGFREPYQTLVTASIILDAASMKIDLVPALTRTVRGTGMVLNEPLPELANYLVLTDTVKPMITQCCIRHLYATKDQTIISSAKEFERKRCGHHLAEQPLSAQECLRSVLSTAKGTPSNPHRYIVAVQEPEIRAELRAIPGVPLIYITRSVMILEPISAVSQDTREKVERSKLWQGIKMTGKRKREEELGESVVEKEHTGGRKRVKGPKGPNPLSVKKPKNREEDKRERPKIPVQI